MIQKILTPLILIAALSGCGNDDLPDYFLLDRLRVLAVTNSTAAAEFSPNDSVTVSFHISDPVGVGRTLSYSMVTCVDPGVNLGAKPTCTGNPTATTAVTGTFISGSAATNYYGVLTPAAVTIPSASVVFIDPTTGGTRSAIDQFNGVGYLVVLTLTTPTGETATSLKRLVVSTKATKNQNPTFSSPELLFNGTAAAAYTLTTDFFSVLAQVPSSSQESYSIESSDGSFSTTSENLTLTYLVSSGKMRFSRTDVGTENRYSPDATLAAVTTFIAVLRDDRGGVAVYAIQKP